MTEQRIYTPPPIAGYRKLTESEVADVNHVKWIEARVLSDVDELLRKNTAARGQNWTPPGAECGTALDARCVELAVQHLQIGFMFLVRSITKPTS